MQALLLIFTTTESKLQNPIPWMEVSMAWLPRVTCSSGFDWTHEQQASALRYLSLSSIESFWQVLFSGGITFGQVRETYWHTFFLVWRDHSFSLPKGESSQGERQGRKSEFYRDYGHLSMHYEVKGKEFSWCWWEDIVVKQSNSTRTFCVQKQTMYEIGLQIWPVIWYDLIRNTVYIYIYISICIYIYIYRWKQVVYYNVL